jgi:hypothetical protein
MSLQIGGKTEVHSSSPEDEVLVQEGPLEYHGVGEQTVYYPISYASPPNLQVTRNVELVEQKADHFRIRTDGSCGGSTTWKARGVRAPKAVPFVPGPPDPLPPAPVPVGGGAPPQAK